MEGTNQQSVMLGKYRLLAELGHGGMAQVFLALAKGVAGFNKLVVVKVIQPDLAEDPDFIRMFLDEARLAARLNHPNVVQTNEVDHDGKRYFLAMEYLEGQTLNRVFNRMGRDPKLLPLGHRLRLIADSLSGLHYAHELRDFDGTALGVVHRDVTPHNVFVTYDGLVKVVDFGIAKALNSNAHTQSGVLKGKVSYMAPEQARGERVDRRADLFSVGMILWQVATGKRLYRDLADMVVIQKLCSNEIPKVGTMAPFVPTRLQAIIDRALAPDRTERYATAAELQADIEAYLEQTGSRITAREIGKLAAEHFAEERAEIQGIIEEQLRQEVQESAVVALPNLGQKGSESGRSTARGISVPTGTVPGAAAITPATGDTATSVTYTGPTRLQRRRKRNRAIGVGATLAVLLGAGLAIGLWPKTGTDAAGVPTASASAAAKTFTLRIDSQPAGATVTERGNAVGTTPLSIPIDPETAIDRVFVVNAPGYAPYEVRPGKLSSDLTVLAPLVAAATATDAGSAAVQPTSGPGGRPGHGSKPGEKPKATATPSSNDTDIRTSR
jgi:eukaryotic-like serine/threonine-protein kinase